MKAVASYLVYGVVFVLTACVPAAEEDTRATIDAAVRSTTEASHSAETVGPGSLQAVTPAAELITPQDPGVPSPTSSDTSATPRPTPNDDAPRTVGPGLVATTQPLDLTSIQVTPAAVDIVAGEQVQLSVMGFDREGSVVSGYSADWQSTVPSGSITQSGLFRATAAGTYSDNLRVVVTFGDSTIAADLDVTVRPGPLHQISVTPAELDLTVAEQVQVSVSGRDVFGNDVPVAVQSITSPAGSFDGATFAAGTRSGDYPSGLEIRASGNGQSVTESVDVTLKPGPLATVVPAASTYTVVAGDQVEISFTASDEFGNQIPDPSVLVTTPAMTQQASASRAVLSAPTKSGSYPGGVQIQGNTPAGQVAAIASLVVEPAALNQVTLTAGSTSLFTGDTITLSYATLDRFGNEATDAVLTWQSSSGIVEPSQDGATFAAGREPGLSELTLVASDGETTATGTISLEVAQGTCQTVQRSTIWRSAWYSYSSSLEDLSTLVSSSESTDLPGGNWGTGQVVSGYSERLRLVATGVIVVQNHRPVTFTVGGDDGYRLRLNGSLVPGLSNWSTHTYNRRTALVDLEPGAYEVQLDYFESSGAARLTFEVDPDVLQWDEVAECTGGYSIPPDNAVWVTSASVAETADRFGLPPTRTIESVADGDRYLAIRGSSTSRKVIVLQGLGTQASCSDITGAVAPAVGTDGVIPLLRLKDGTWQQLSGLAANRALFAAAVQREYWLDYHRPSPIDLSNMLAFSYGSTYRECDTPGAAVSTDQHPGTGVYASYSEAHTCQGVEAGAEQLQKLIERLAALNPNVQVDLVGHSLGGMVSAYLMADRPAFASQYIRSLVTLDSPLLSYPDFDEVPFIPCGSTARSVQDISGNTPVIDMIMSLAGTPAATTITSIVTSVGHAVPGNESIRRDCDQDQSLWLTILGLLSGGFWLTLGGFLLGDVAESLDGHSCVWTDPVTIDVVARTVVSDDRYIEPKILTMEWLDSLGNRVCRAGDGSEVILRTTVQGYRDGAFQVPILEVDPFNPDDLTATVQMQVIDGVGTASWIARWQSDGWLGLGGDPEMKYVVQGMDSRQLVVQQNSLYGTQLCPSAEITGFQFDRLAPQSGGSGWADVTVANTGGSAATFGVTMATKRESGQVVELPIQGVTLNQGESKTLRFPVEWGEAGPRDVRFTIWQEVADPLEHILDTTGWQENLVVVQ